MVKPVSYREDFNPNGHIIAAIVSGEAHGSNYNKALKKKRIIMPTWQLLAQILLPFKKRGGFFCKLCLLDEAGANQGHINCLRLSIPAENIPFGHQ